MENRPDGNMIPVGTPGLGVRQPDGFSLGWKWLGWKWPGWKWLGWKWLGWKMNADGTWIGPMRVADAQTGRPYSEWDFSTGNRPDGSNPARILSDGVLSRSHPEKHESETEIIT
jgi:hypothetical protein